MLPAPFRSLHCHSVGIYLKRRQEQWLEKETVYLYEARFGIWTSDIEGGDDQSAAVQFVMHSHRILFIMDGPFVALPTELLLVPNGRHLLH